MSSSYAVFCLNDPAAPEIYVLSLHDALPILMLAIGFGAVAFGEGFRRYSITTMVILIGFGALTAQDAPRIAANLPTPMIGVWERISIVAYMRSEEHTSELQSHVKLVCRLLLE